MSLVSGCASHKQASSGQGQSHGDRAVASDANPVLQLRGGILIHRPTFASYLKETYNLVHVDEGSIWGISKDSIGKRLASGFFPIGSMTYKFNARSTKAGCFGPIWR